MAKKASQLSKDKYDNFDLQSTLEALLEKEKTQFAMATKTAQVGSLVSDRVLTRIFHRSLRQVGQDVALDSFSNDREHCHIDKTRGFKDEDGVTDCPNCPSGCEKCGLKDERVTKATEAEASFLKNFLRNKDEK